MLKKSVLLIVFSALTALACAAPALASHPFLVVNAGRHTVEHLQISGINRSMWGPDLLGRYVLRPGQRVTITIGEGCAEDIRVIYSDNYVIQRHDYNTCASSGVRLLY